MVSVLYKQARPFGSRRAVAPPPEVADVNLADAGKLGQRPVLPHHHHRLETAVDLDAERGGSRAHAIEVCSERRTAFGDRESLTELARDGQAIVGRHGRTRLDEECRREGRRGEAHEAVLSVHPFPAADRTAKNSRRAGAAEAALVAAAIVVGSFAGGWLIVNGLPAPDPVPPFAIRLEETLP